MKKKTSHTSLGSQVRRAIAETISRSGSITFDKSESPDSQAGSNLLNSLEACVRAHSGANELVLDASKQVVRLLVLIDGECSCGRHHFLIKNKPSS